MNRLRILLCLTFVGVPAIASATESRKTGLARNYLHVDDADFFLYPGMQGENYRYVFADAYTAQPDGDGGILLGAGPVFSATFDHPALWNDLADMDSIYGAVQGGLAHHVLDLGLAFPGGRVEAPATPGAGWTRSEPTSAFGLLLGWGRGVFDAAVEDPTEAGSFLSTGAEANVIDLSAGYSSWATGQTRMDLGFGITENLYEEVAAGDVTLRTTKAPGIHAVGRFFIPMRQDLDIGIEGLVARRDYGVEIVGPGGTEGTYSRLLGRFSIGPRIHPNERVTIGFFGRVHVERLSGQVNDVDGPTMTYIGFPGAGVAIEAAPIDHLSVRLGVDYQHAYERVTTNPPGAANNTIGAFTANGTNWGFGLGYGRDAYKLDMAMTGTFDFGATAGTQFVLAGAYSFR